MGEITLKEMEKQVEKTQLLRGWTFHLITIFLKRRANYREKPYKNVKKKEKQIKKGEENIFDSTDKEIHEKVREEDKRKKEKGICSEQKFSPVSEE